MEHSHDVLDNVSGSGTDFSLSPQAISFLTETRKWVNFLAILGFIAIGLMVISGLFFGTLMGAMVDQTGMSGMGGSAFFGVFYIIMPLFIFSRLCIYTNSEQNLKLLWPIATANH